LKKSNLNLKIQTNKKNICLMEIKVGLIGKNGVGKSTIKEMIKWRKFVTDYDPTIEEHDQFKQIINEEEFLIRIMDPNNQSNKLYSSITIKNSDIIVLFYSITDESSFEEIDELYKSVLQVVNINNKKKKDCDYFHCLLVGCKKDLDSERQVSIQEGEEKAKKYKIDFMEVSAKNYEEVKQLFHESIVNSNFYLDYQKKKIMDFTKKDKNKKGLFSSLSFSDDIEIKLSKN
jgi:small GTP-binding protein